jgi:hypothetical protein
MYAVAVVEFYRLVGIGWVSPSLAGLETNTHYGKHADAWMNMMDCIWISF